MNITLSKTQGKVPVAILKIDDRLDGSNYKDLIAKAQEIIKDGSRHILIDMTDVSFMSSAGMVALQSIAKLLKGQQLGDEEGWSLLHSIERERGSGKSQHLKLLNPQPKIEQALEVTGFIAMLEVYKDLEQAIASF